MTPARSEAELTIRGLCLGAVITIVFMSANVYLGLKTGITFSSSIPAAVISMSLLKLMGGGGILENNIVQTQASAAGTLCNVNLVLPGLVLIHYWNGFPLWQTMAVCLLGGLLGVAFSVPLRRVMVVDSDLPFPEGVAAAEVLTSGHGDGDERDRGLRDLSLSALVAGALALLNTGTQLLSDKIGGALILGGSVFKFDLGLSLALIGIGYLVRIGCCLALLIGILIAWAIAVPLLSQGSANTGAGGDASTIADSVWASKVRLIGAGLIAVAGLWTVATLVRPTFDTIRSSAKAKGSSSNNAASKDVPIVWVGAGVAVLALPLGALVWVFLAGSGTTISLALFVPALTAITAIFAILMATACGYLAGLLGSSSSPISGIAILTGMMVIATALLVLPSASPADARVIGALSLFLTSIIITASSIANDNLQDLKAGHIVGATPWKQQAALAIGVALGAITIAPVLELLYHAYGFVGALPREDMDVHRAMPAPQAALLTQVADGIVNHHLDWAMLAIGTALGVVFVALESVLHRRRFTLPALSVGIGIYLPCAIVATIALGGVIGWLAERAVGSAKAQEAARRKGVLLSSGFLVGESLIGILIALTDISLAKSGALTLYAGDGSALRTGISLALFVGLTLLFYRLVSRPAR